MSIPIPARVLLTLALIVLLAALSLTPDREQAGDGAFGWVVHVTPPAVQKVAHLLAYALLAGMAAWTLAALEPRALRLTLAFVGTVAIGAALEWGQTHIPGRFGTLADVLLNAAGALVGVVVTAVLL